MRLGFIGLGAMGQPMALQLMRAGHQLSLWGRRRDRLQPLLDQGAMAFASPAELGRHAEMVLTMVTAGDDVAEVTLGPDGLIHGFSPGSVHVDMSTIDPQTARSIAGRLAVRGVAMLDAPVSGGVAAAKSGTLAIMVGGAAATFERARPVLAALGKTIVHVGGAGAGQVAKACNQMVMVATIEACAEAMRLAAASGVAPERVRAAMMGGAGGSTVLDVFGGRMTARDYQAGVEARLHHKDFGIVMREACRLGCPLPVGAQVWQQLNALMAHGWGGQDSASLIKVLEAAHA